MIPGELALSDYEQVRVGEMRLLEYRGGDKKKLTKTRKAIPDPVEEEDEDVLVGSEQNNSTEIEGDSEISCMKKGEEEPAKEEKEEKVEIKELFRVGKKCLEDVLAENVNEKEWKGEGLRPYNCTIRRVSGNDSVVEICASDQLLLDRGKMQLLRTLAPKRDFKQHLTHFFSIPIGKAAELESLQQEIATRFPYALIDRSTFQPMDSVHISMMVMTLNSASDIERMKTAMDSKIQDFVKKTLATCSDRKELQIEFEGLSFFGKSEKCAKVLFLKPKKCRGTNFLDKLFSFLNKLLFEENFLMKREERDFVIHTTVAKTALYISRKGDDPRKEISFDLGKVLSHDFQKAVGALSFVPTELHLSKFELKPGSYYTCEHKIAL